MRCLHTQSLTVPFKELGTWNIPDNDVMVLEASDVSVGNNNTQVQTLWENYSHQAPQEDIVSLSHVSCGLKLKQNGLVAIIIVVFGEQRGKFKVC